jgi:hypothetical protein
MARLLLLTWMFRLKDDMSLDASYHQTRFDGTYAAAYELWTGPRAQAAGVTYLTEGTYNFTLSNGARLCVYASPYTPEFCNMGFPYERHEDRYNPPAARLAHTESIASATSTIPSFPGVDVLITHGPPWQQLDLVAGSDAHVGCKALAHALARVRPRMHCFGHIHEGWGAKTVAWPSKQGSGDSEGVPIDAAQLSPAKPGAESVYIDISNNADIAKGKESLLVNAAIMDVRYRPVNAPFIVDLMLSKGSPTD